MDTLIPETDQKTPRPPNCIRCTHFKVSWDPVMPHSCVAFSIKSRLMPSVEVFRAAGGVCPFFREKEGLK